MRHFAANRRHFIKTAGRGALALPILLKTGFLTGCVNPSPRPEKMVRHDTYVLKNGSVFVNGSFEKIDLTVEHGVITGIGNETDRTESVDARVIDCSGLFVSPGWVDFHCHVGGVGVDPALLGPEMGVTAIVEAGTYGPSTFDEFMARYHARSRIPIYVFLNVRKNGIRYSNVLFKSRPGVEDVEGARRLITRHPDVIKGLKVRLDAMNTPNKNPSYLADVTADLGREMQMPVMAHLGIPPPSISDFLQRMKPGDIITHCFRKKNNSVIHASGKVQPEVVHAQSEGVLFDVGHGVGSFEFASARKAFDQKFRDFTISSDLWLLPAWFRCRTFANVASKFLALGMGLEEVTARISSLPRKRLHIGSEIVSGCPMDLTIFSVVNGPFQYTDTAGESLSCPRKIIPEYTLVGGDLIRAGNRDRDLFLS